jgi:subtilisin family serine protease
MPIFAAIPHSLVHAAGSRERRPREVLIEEQGRALSEGVVNRLRKSFRVTLAAPEEPESVGFALADRRDASIQVLSAVNVLLAQGSLELKRFLEGDPDIAEVLPADQAIAEPPPSGDASGTPSAWHLPATNAHAAHAAGVTGAGVWIGVADTGIDDSHDEFKGKSVVFGRADSNGAVTNGVAGDSDPFGHGTHVAAVAAGNTIGVAPGAGLAVVDVLNGGTGTMGTILTGLDWLAKLQRPDGRQGVDIVNASFVTIGPSRSAAYSGALKGVVRTLRFLGMTVIAAIGNDGPGTHGSPGNYVDVLGIGAFDDVEDPWCDCSQGWVPEENVAKPDLWAPGVNVTSASCNGGYEIKTGSSFAAPIAAGVAALYRQREGDQVDLIKLMIATSRPLQGPQASGGNYRAVQYL